ncbi:hypothetical protein TNIN_399591, partial [Trichonephila inaurata madagascariensis]
SLQFVNKFVKFIIEHTYLGN